MPINYKYCGFTLRWNYFDESVAYPTMKELALQATIPIKVFDDIRAVLEILSKAELLFPTYILLDEKIQIEAKTVKEFCAKLEKILPKHKEQLSLLKIGGYGIIYLENNKKAIVDDLVNFDDIRYFDRQFSISTSKSVWSIINFDDSYEYEWQIEQAKLNAPRLENVLIEIAEKLQLETEPKEEEIETENPIWIKGYKLFPDLNLLQETYNEKPPKYPFDIKKYINSLGNFDLP